MKRRDRQYTVSEAQPRRLPRPAVPGAGDSLVDSTARNTWESAPQVLMVEDDEALRESLSEHLSYSGFKMVAVATGSEALEQVRTHRFDLILLDVRLPDADGRDLCRRILEFGRSPPIIMLTAADSSADIVRGFDSGAYDYVVKPVSPPALVARMRGAPAPSTN